MIYMGTTKISPERTAGEIQQTLSKCGATQIATDYDKGKITALRWTMAIQGKAVCFSLPIRVDPVFRVMNTRGRADRAQAERTAWRLLLRWTQAQLALIETGMVDAAEVFTPYLQVNNKQTLYQKLLEGGGLRMLSAPKD